MANMEKLQTYPVICEGGLDSNKNHLFLSQATPGAATALVNFEPSLFGGYRKLNGFVPLEENFAEVDPTGAEGKILLTHIYDDTILAARKTQSASTYKIYFWTSGADWTEYTTGLTLTATNVHLVRAASYNLQGPESVIFVDGVNLAYLYDGTNWTDIDPEGTGADYANAGGPMALETPKYVTTFKNHLFVAGDAASPQIVAHSAPETDYDWTAASGAGQINVGFAVRQIKPHRDALFVFGDTKIRKIVVDGTTFVVQDVTSNGGLLASDSVIEINGDLLFLSADGIRPIAATERNEDVELGVVSKKIQQDMIDLIEAANFPGVQAVVVRRKSQARFFFSDENLDTERNIGILGGLKGTSGNYTWEWARIRGIRASCCTSGYLASQEYVIHGDYNGKVYRQEQGNSFDGADIPATYTTPYLDFGDPYVRKTLHKVLLFLRPEASVELSMGVKFDWGDQEAINPSSYVLESTIIGTTYGTGIYGVDVYAASPPPITFKNVEGSHFSSNLTFTADGTDGSFSIQAIVFEYSTNGRK